MGKGSLGPILKRWAPKAWWLGAGALLLFWSTSQLGFVARAIDFPYELISHEGAHLLTTKAFAEGRNPWAPEHAPVDYNCYGPLNSMAVAAVYEPGQQGLRAHRLLALEALLLAACLLGMAFYRLSGSGFGAWAAALAVFSGFLFCVTPTAGTNGLAVLGFVAPICLTVLWPTTLGALLAAGLAAAAFFAKAYAAAAGPLICLAFLMARRWKLFWVAGTAWALLLALGVLAVERHWPGYLDATFFLAKNGAALDNRYTQVQMGIFAISAWPWALLLVIGLARKGAQADRSVLAMFAATFALLAFWLGRNIHGHLYYHLQLLNPVGLLAVAAVWRGGLEGSRWAQAMLLLAVWTGMSNNLLHDPRYKQRDLPQWQRAEAWVAGAAMPLLPPTLTSVAIRHGKPIADNGLTSWLANAPEGPLKRAYQAHERLWDQRVAEGKADLVFWLEGSKPRPGLLRNYQEVDRLCFTPPAELVDILCYRVLKPKASRPAAPQSAGR